MLIMTGLEGRTQARNDLGKPGLEKSSAELYRKESRLGNIEKVTRGKLSHGKEICQ